VVERLFFAERRLRQHLVFEPAKRLGVFDVKAYMHNGVFQSQCLVRVRLAPSWIWQSQTPIYQPRRMQRNPC